MLDVFTIANSSARNTINIFPTPYYFMSNKSLDRIHIHTEVNTYMSAQGHFPTIQALLKTLRITSGYP